MLLMQRIPDGYYQESRISEQAAAERPAHICIRDIMCATAIIAVICAGVKNVLSQTAYLSNDVQLKAKAPTTDR